MPVGRFGTSSMHVGCLGREIPYAREVPYHSLHSPPECYREVNEMDTTQQKWVGTRVLDISCVALNKQTNLSWLCPVSGGWLSVMSSLITCRTLIQSTRSY